MQSSANEGTPHIVHDPEVLSKRGAERREMMVQGLCTVAACMLDSSSSFRDVASKERKAQSNLSVVDKELSRRGGVTAVYLKLRYGGKKELRLTPEDVCISSHGDADNPLLPDHMSKQPIEVTFSLAENNGGFAVLEHKDPRERCEERVLIVLPQLTNLADRPREWILQPGNTFDALMIFQYPAHAEQPLLGRREITIALCNHVINVPVDFNNALIAREVLPQRGVPKNDLLIAPQVEESMRCVQYPVKPGSVVWIRFTYTPEIAGEQGGGNTLLLRQCGKGGDMIAESREVLPGTNEWYDAIVYVEKGVVGLQCLFQSGLPHGLRVEYLTAEVVHKSGVGKP